MENLYRPAIARSYGRRLKEYVMLAVADPSVLKSDYVLPPDYEIMTETAEVFTKALLLGMEPEQNNFADDVDVLPFEEAVAYMRKRLPVDGKTYYALADKMRYRAFTVSRLADGDAVRQVQSMLVKAMDEGSGIQQFLQLTEGQLADAAGMGRGAGWYYETVYRTNTATAYNVGRAIGFEETPPIALELIGIDDARQTEICHSLTVPPFRRPYGDPVWEHMWPPFHFNCRTTVRAIYDESEIEDAGGPDKFYSRGMPDYTPDKGFGAYPLDKSDAWWDLTDAMKNRAEGYGLKEEFTEARKKLIGGDKQPESFDPIRNAIDAEPETEEGIRKIGEAVINKAKEENKSIMEILQEYRDFGTDKTHIWQKGSSLAAKEEMLKSYRYFPKEWVEKSIAVSEQNPVLLKKTIDRGGYRNSPPAIWLSQRPSCAAHELSHRMERVMPEIVQREKEFYERRTAGEAPQDLRSLTGNKKFRLSEKARPDKFNNPYMGKDCGGGAYEILSMGVEKIFFGCYTTKEDLDFDAFIIGLLLGV